MALHHRATLPSYFCCTSPDRADEENQAYFPEPHPWLKLKEHRVLVDHWKSAGVLFSSSWIDPSKVPIWPLTLSEAFRIRAETFEGDTGALVAELKGVPFLGHLGNSSYGSISSKSVRGSTTSRDTVSVDMEEKRKKKLSGESKKHLMVKETVVTPSDTIASSTGEDKADLRLKREPSRKRPVISKPLKELKKDKKKPQDLRANVLSQAMKKAASPEIPVSRRPKVPRLSSPRQSPKPKSLSAYGLIARLASFKSETAASSTSAPLSARKQQKNILRPSVDLTWGTLKRKGRRKDGPPSSAGSRTPSVFASSAGSRSPSIQHSISCLKEPGEKISDELSVGEPKVDMWDMEVEQDRKKVKDEEEQEVEAGDDFPLLTLPSIRKQTELLTEMGRELFEDEPADIHYVDIEELELLVKEVDDEIAKAREEFEDDQMNFVLKEIVLDEISDIADTVQERRPSSDAILLQEADLANPPELPERTPSKSRFLMMGGPIRPAESNVAESEVAKTILSSKTSPPASARKSKITSQVAKTPSSASSHKSKITSQVAKTPSPASARESKITSQVAKTPSPTSARESKITSQVAKKPSLASARESKITSQVAKTPSPASARESKITSPVAKTPSPASARESKITSQVAKTTSLASARESKITSQVAKTPSPASSHKSKITSQMVGSAPDGSTYGAEVQESEKTQQEKKVSTASKRGEASFTGRLDSVKQTPADTKAADTKTADVPAAPKGKPTKRKKKLSLKRGESETATKLPEAKQHSYAEPLEGTIHQEAAATGSQQVGQRSIEQKRSGEHRKSKKGRHGSQEL